MRIFIFTFIVTLSLFSATLQEMKTENRYAFIIANGVQKENFNDPNIKSAKKFEKFLKSKKFKTVAAYNMKRSSLIKTFRQFDQNIAPNSIIMIVYSGKVVTLNSQSWIIPAAANIESLKQLRLSGVSINFMLTKFQRHSPRAIVAFLDGYRYSTHANKTNVSTISNSLKGTNNFNQIVLWSGDKKSSTFFTHLTKTVAKKTNSLSSVASSMKRYKAKSSIAVSSFYFNLPSKIVTPEDSAWKRATAKKSIVGYEAFLIAYPNSMYKENAVGKIDAIYAKARTKAKARKSAADQNAVKKAASAKQTALELEQAKSAKQKQELELLQAQLALMSKEKSVPKKPKKIVFYEPEEMLVIPAGVFTMGSAAFTNAQPVHKVRLKKSFKLSAFEVSNKAYSAYLKATGKKYRKKKLLKEKSAAVSYVSWQDAQDYILWLNKMSAKQYRLPTEAEWEYALRAGSTTNFYWGENKALAPQYAWLAKNAHGFVHTRGILQPNKYGLYDMAGNVAEWCEDSAADNYKNADSDASKPFIDIDAMKIIRGGSYRDEVEKLSSAYRESNIPTYRHPTIGFRLAEDR